MRARRWVVWGVGLAALATPRRVAAETYTDETLGFSVQVPQGWKAIPIPAEEQYVVARWLSDREYADKTGEVWAFRPELKVVLFDPTAKRSVEEKDLGEGVKSLRVKNPYRTYRDWIKSDATGGRYISKEEPTVVGGVNATWYEVAYEKLTVPRHGLAFVYHAGDVDFCVTTEVLEQSWKQLSPVLLRTMRSFKTFARTGSLERPAASAGDEPVFRSRDKLTPQERWIRRLESFERRLELATQRLPKGWKVKRSKNYAALSHADDRFTDLVLDQAEGVRAWADANLGFFGEGIPGPEILRICKDHDEERAFRDVSSKSETGWVREICLSRQEAFWGLGHVAGEIFDRWLDDKNPRLSYSLPPWLGRGIREWVDSAYVKGGKLEFRQDAGLLVALKLAARQGTLIPPSEMLLLSNEELMNRDRGGQGDAPDGVRFGPFSRTSAWQQAAGFVRYLLAGPGRTHARSKDLLATYVRHLDEIVKERDAKAPTPGEVLKEPQTEEEEEERFKKRETFWKDHQKELLKETFDKTFASWTAADWAALEKSYRAYAN